MTSVDTAKEAIMYKALIESPRISLCLSNISEMINAITLNLSDVFFFIDFEIILSIQTINNVFKAEPVINNYSCCPALYKLQA